MVEFDKNQAASFAMEIEKREGTTAAEAREKKTMRRARDGVMKEMAFSKFGNSLVDLFINILTCFSKLLWRSLHGKMDKNRI